MSEQEPHKKFEEQLASGQIRMRPRMYFVVRALAITLILILISLLAIFLSSIITFASHRNGWWVLPTFGWGGWGPFLASLPWLLIGFVAILIIMVEALSWYFTALYRRPALYTVLGVAFVILGLGVLADQWHVHEFVQSRHMPIMQPLYRQVDTYHPRNTYYGMLVSTSTDVWQILNYQGQSQVVVISGGTRLPPEGAVDLHDTLVIFGDCDNDDATITARGIRKVSPGRLPDYVRGSWQSPPPTQK